MTQGGEGSGEAFPDAAARASGGGPFESLARLAGAAATQGGADPVPAASAADRISRALREEADRRLRLTMAARTVALAALAPVVALVSGWPEALFPLGGIVVFAALGWVQQFATRAMRSAAWLPFLLVALDFALLTYVLLAPNPFREFQLPPQLHLRFGNFIYFFLLLAGLAFSFRPGLVLWGGATGALFWTLGRLWVISAPGTVTSLDESFPTSQAEMDALVAYVMQPNFVDLGIWIQEVAVFLVVSGMMALVVRGSRGLVHRQAMLERRSANLSRYFPARMAERMAERDDPFAGDSERSAAVMFTDIVGFTGWAEGRPSAEVMSFLRGAHAVVAGAVFETGGVLDKFIGDGAMATFGAAPDPDERSLDAEARAARHARASLVCAELILERFDAFNRLRTETGHERMRISIGVHFGPVVVGDVGSDRRMELAVLGDTVNVASRLESLTRPLRCAAAASEEAIAAAGGPRPGWRLAGTQAIPGRRGAEVVWVRDAPGAAEEGE